MGGAQCQGYGNDVCHGDDQYILSSCKYNQPLNNWNETNVTGMNYMFEWAARFNQPLNNWNVGKVK